MNIQSLLLIVPISTYAILIYVFSLHRKIKANFYFLLMLISFFLWNTEALLTHLTTDNSVAIFITKLTFISSLFSLYFLFIFSSYFPNNNERIRKPVPIYLVVCVFTSILVLTTNLVIDLSPNISPEKGNIYTTGQLFILFLLVALYFICLIIYNFLHSFRNARGIYLIQIKYILIGTSLSSIIGLVIGLVLPLLHYTSSENFIPFVPYAAVLFYTYIILKHRFLDVSLVISRLFLIFVLSIFAYAAFYFILWYENTYIGSPYEKLSYIVGLPLAYLYAFLAVSFEKFLTDHNVLRGLYNVQEIQDSLIKQLNKYINIDDVAKHFCDSLRDNLRIEYAALFLNSSLHNQEQERFIYITDGGRNIDIAANIFNEIGLKEMVTDELEIALNNNINRTNSRLGILKFLQTQNIAVYLPLIIEEKLIGCLLLGNKANQDGYSSQDIKFLKTLSIQLSITLQNALLHRETVDFNKTLEVKIKQATLNIEQQKSELQDAYNKLKEATQKEHDMVDIMGHELRTPATVIKLAVYLLEQKNQDNICNKYITEIKDNVENEIELINTLLHASKLDNSKLEIDPTYEDFTQIVHEVITEEQVSAKDKGLSLHLLPILESIPKTLLDKHRIREAVTNYLTNAIKYTNQGDIEVGINLSNDKKSIIFSVKDNGIGFKKEDEDFLFQKFHRLNNYIGTDETKHLVRPGGTGLGLYVVKGMIELHEGKVWAESLGVNKGATFYFSLPIKAPSNPTDVSKPDKEMNMFERLNLKDQL